MNTPISKINLNGTILNIQDKETKGRVDIIDIQKADVIYVDSSIEALETSISVVQSYASGVQSNVNVVQSNVDIVQGNVDVVQGNVDVVQGNVDVVQGNVDNIIAYFKQSMHRVGDLIYSVSSENPSIVYGGTWVEWGAGKFPVGIDPSSIDFNTINKTGGSISVTLTKEQIPLHDHGVQLGGTDGNSEALLSKRAYGTPSSGVTVGTGGGQPHDNLPPYKVCYIWKKTE